MPNYLDLMNQLQDKRRASLAEYSPTNPYTSSAYTHQYSQDLYTQSEGEVMNLPIAEGYIPSEFYTAPTMEEKLMKGVSNVATSQQLSATLKNVASGVGQKYLGGVAQTIPNPAVGAAGHVSGVKVGAPIANPAVGAAGPIAGVTPGGYGAISAIAYAAANDNNPYTYGTKEAVGMGIGDAALTTAATTAMGVYAPWMPLVAAGLGWLFRKRRAKRLKAKEDKIISGGDESIVGRYNQKLIEERKKRDYYQSLRGREKGNLPYGVSPSSTGALPASQGMKYKYNTGGIKIGDIQAEFTGNELIVNNQDVVESGLKEKNYSKAAAPIRQAMRSGYITPGPETHQNNPMPVTTDGTIYAGGGPLNFKVKNGAGVYDHATDQFKSTMSDKQIAMVAQKNINKWKSNNMYS